MKIKFYKIPKMMKSGKNKKNYQSTKNNNKKNID